MIIIGNHSFFLITHLPVYLNIVDFYWLIITQIKVILKIRQMGSYEEFKLSLNIRSKSWFKSVPSSECIKTA